MLLLLRRWGGIGGDRRRGEVAVAALVLGGWGSPAGATLLAGGTAITGVGVGLVVGAASHHLLLPGGLRAHSD